MADSLLDRAREHLRGGEVAQAARLLDGVLRKSPKDVDALLLRGLASAAAMDVDDAVARLKQASKIAPHSAAIHVELGRIFLDLARLPSLAAAAFNRAVERDPHSIDAAYLLGKALFQLGDADQALAQFVRARQGAVSAGRDADAALCQQSIAVMIPGAPSADNAQILAARADWAESKLLNRRPDDVPLSDRWRQRDRSPGRRLVVGYVSSFFDRENWMKPVWSLLNAHDREAFQVRIFSFGPVPGGDQPGSAADSAWRPHATDRIFDVAGLSNEALVDVILDEQVDVLVDLNGYSDPARLPLFELRPAPLGVGWFNMYATTGMECYSLLIGDRHVVLPDEEALYSEPIGRVPGSYLTFRVDYTVPEVSPPPSRASGSITFGSLASRYKITPPVIDAWAEILRRAPDAQLVLRNAGLDADCERQYLHHEFEKRGIVPRRVELLGRLPHFEFLQTYERIDIALDTFPYNGGTTTTEAIWQGVPVVAFNGTTWAGRTSTTLLREGGLGEWVADNVAGYVERASRWGNDPLAPGKLATLRAGLRRQLLGAPVCDTSTFTCAMEGLYRQLWINWCRTAPNE